MDNSRARVFSVCTFILLTIIIFTASPIKAQDDQTLVDSVMNLVADSLKAQDTPLPPVNVVVKDSPDDDGGSITVSWEASPSEAEKKVTQYKIYRAESDNGTLGEWVRSGEETAGKTESTDGNVDDNKEYFYKIEAINMTYDANGDLIEYSSETSPVGPVKSSAQWIHKQRINALVATLLLSFFIIYYIDQAKKGKKLFIRKLAGMEAVQEAVGRATEMGKKIFYVPGIGDMDNMQTIAAMTILGKVAELTAEYDTYLDVPVCRSLVMVTGREVVKEAFSKVGRPDAFKEDQVHYLTDDQFGYAAAVDGAFVREKPATIFFMGQFYAESLILAETGNSIGAIQIAGTAMPSQLPFFVAACDYTLIGEELFAASAYLSNEPKLLGSLKGQDIGKGLILILLIIGYILETLNIWQFSQLFRVIGQ